MEPGFSDYSNAFESTMAGFSRLTDAGKLNVQPKRIKIQQVQKDGTAKEVLASLGVPASQLNEVALLNEVKLTDQIAERNFGEDCEIAYLLFTNNMQKSLAKISKAFLARLFY